LRVPYFLCDVSINLIGSLRVFMTYTRHDGMKRIIAFYKQTNKILSVDTDKKQLPDDQGVVYG